MTENIQEGSGETDCLDGNGQTERSVASKQEIAGEMGYIGSDEKSESGVVMTIEKIYEQNAALNDKVTKMGHIFGCKRKTDDSTQEQPRLGCKRKTDDSTEERRTQKYIKCLVVGPSQELIESLIPIEAVGSLNLTPNAEIQRQIAKLEGANNELRRKLSLFQQLFRNKQRLKSVTKTLYPSMIFAGAKRG